MKAGECGAAKAEWLPHPEWLQGHVWRADWSLRSDICEANEGEALSARGHPTDPHLFPDGQLQALSLDPRPRTPEVLMKALLVSRCVRHEVFLGTQEQHRLLPHTEDDTLLSREAIGSVLHGHQSPVQPLGLCLDSSSLIGGWSTRPVPPMGILNKLKF